MCDLVSQSLFYWRMYVIFMQTVMIMLNIRDNILYICIILYIYMCVHINIYVYIYNNISVLRLQGHSTEILN